MKLTTFAMLGACAALTVVTGAGLGTSAAGAATTRATVYDSTEAPLPGNVVSDAAEANGFSELGDEVSLSGTQRTLQTVTVTLSSWGCENGTWYQNNCSSSPRSTFAVPITLSIYRTAGEQGDGTVLPGERLAKVIKSFDIPYRPSADLRHCNTANNAVGRWYDKKSQTCFNGKAVNIVFNFASLKLALPDSIVLGVAYNTSHHGYNPIGDSADCYSEDGGCGYDSLNVGLNDDPSAPSVGTQDYPGAIFETLDENTNDRCDETPTEGVLNLNSPTSPGCWAGYVPEFKVTARG